MNYVVCEYPRDGSRRYGIYCKTSRCFVLFGRKKELLKRVKELNNN